MQNVTSNQLIYEFMRAMMIVMNIILSEHKNNEFSGTVKQKLILKKMSAFLVMKWMVVDYNEKD